jgi:hypothetical protein
MKTDAVHMHGIHQTDAFFHPAFFDQPFNCSGDVDEPASVRNFKPKMLGQAFHVAGMPKAEFTGNEEFIGRFDN